MSAQVIYDTAPLGALIRYSDGASKPPLRFRKKVAAWERNNGVGRLVRKQAQRNRPNFSAPATITLHEGDFGSGGVVVLTVMRTYDLNSSLSFEIVERPAIGMGRVLRNWGGCPELVHLAANREAAERWLASKCDPSLRLEEVAEDEIAIGASERSA